MEVLGTLVRTRGGSMINEQRRTKIAEDDKEDVGGKLPWSVSEVEAALLIERQVGYVKRGGYWGRSSLDRELAAICRISTRGGITRAWPGVKVNFMSQGAHHMYQVL